MVNFLNLDSKTLLALLIFGEARGEPIEGQVGVANVVKNRVKQRVSTWKYEILKPKQFSCFNSNDPNRAYLENLVEKGPIILSGKEAKIWEQCLWISEGILLDKLLDNTKGANHYLTKELFNNLGKRPEWADPKKITTILGGHVFLKL